jgi:hypothetical protein
MVRRNSAAKSKAARTLHRMLAADLIPGKARFEPTPSAPRSAVAGFVLDVAG